MLPYITLFSEIFLGVMTGVLLILNAYWGENKRIWIYRITLLTLAVVAFWQLGQLFNGSIFTIFQSDWNLTTVMERKIHYVFSDSYISDPLGRSLSLLSSLAVIVLLLCSRGEVLGGKYATPIKGEFYPLVLTTLNGVLIVIGGYSLLTIYVGIELMSLSLYALVAMRYSTTGPIIELEAAVKYFILGSLASGLLLYGMSMIYGASGTIYISEIRDIVYSGGNTGANQVALLFGIVFIVAGLAFKFGLAPFHNWLPDVYEGAPLAVTTLIASIPKIAILTTTFRILLFAFFPLAEQWQLMLLILAILSVGLGNIAAIAQSNIKRMLGYSAIAQIGFVILGFITAFSANTSSKSFLLTYTGAFFYLLVYIIASLLAFGVLLYLSGNANQRSVNDKADHEYTDIIQLSGLNKSAPTLALLMMIAMFSLAGIPPLAGFYAKFIIIQSLIHSGYLYIAVIAVLLSVVGAFYYLRIVKVMYFDSPINIATIDSTLPAIPRHKPALTALYILGILILLLGIIPADTLSYTLLMIFYSIIPS